MTVFGKLPPSPLKVKVMLAVSPSYSFCTLTVASASSLPRLTVAGGGVLRVADGVTVSLNLTYASGSLDVRLGAGAKFIARNWSGQAPDWVRLNGHMARFRSDGELVPKLGCVVVFQ